MGEIMVCILIDPNYADSVWCKNFLDGLRNELRKNRIPFCEIFEVVPNSTKAVFIIASDYEWAKEAICQLNKYDICPILLCNHFENLEGCQCNCVSSDVIGFVKSLLDEINSAGKRSIALYGVNTNSISDIGKVDTLFTWKDNRIGSVKIFNNDGSLQKCYKSFLPFVDDFDAVICTNDFAAVSLVKNLTKDAPDALKSVTILSMARSVISEYYRSYITSVDINYEQYGKAAVFIYKSIEKHQFISNITVNVPWSIDKSGGFKGVEQAVLNLPESHDSFYDDAEINEMLKIEKLLSICDSTDKIIIKGLLNKLSYENIGRKCFLTENAIKYRIKRLLTDCGISDKSALLKILKKYFRNSEIL